MSRFSSFSFWSWWWTLSDASSRQLRSLPLEHFGTGFFGDGVDFVHQDRVDHDGYDAKDYEKRINDHTTAC